MARAVRAVRVVRAMADNASSGLPTLHRRQARCTGRADLGGKVTRMDRLTSLRCGLGLGAALVVGCSGGSGDSSPPGQEADSAASPPEAGAADVTIDAIDAMTEPDTQSATPEASEEDATDSATAEESP